MRLMQEAPGKNNAPPDMKAVLQSDEFAASGILAWWYRRFAPKPPVGRLVNLREREKIRRGRLASIILAVQLIGIELPVIPVVANAPNGHLVLPWLFGCILALLTAFVFNRRGNLLLAGILMVASIEVTMIVKILTVPGGISVFYLPQFDILIQPILIAVALLVPWSAFAVALFNILFILFALVFGPHAPDLTAALHNPIQVGDLFAVPIMAQIVTSFFGWIIVKNLLEALKQADQAEQIASLEYALAEDRRQAAERNTQLEAGVNAIILTIQQVSNKEEWARVRLSPENILWPIGKQINLFLDRYQKARVSEAELERTKAAILEFANEIYQSNQQRRQFIVPGRKSTPMDAIIIALTGERRPGNSMPPTDSRRGNQGQCL
jgi:hypothetical protein